MAWLVVVLLAATRSAFGHAESLSGLQVLLSDDATRVTFSLPERELSQWFPPKKFNDYGKEVAAELGKLELVQIQYGETTPPEPSRVIAKPAGEASISVEFDYPPLPKTSSDLAVWSTAIGHLPNDHKQFLTVEDKRLGVNRVVAQETLTAIQDAWSGALPDLPAVPAVAVVAKQTAAQRAAAQAETKQADSHQVTSFFALGIEHILTGYDHLLFLAALLLICNRFSDAAKIITVFTIAHSLTLALAALDIVRLPGRVVEPLIAASIIYVAFENILTQDKAQRWRRVIVFAFGLIHGLGFASVLREVGLGSSGTAVAIPLVKFNLGVEVGQLAVAALFLPFVFWLKRIPTFVTRGIPATSAAIAGIGTFWLVTRLINGG
ncbi:MAG: HupE/UreJ family protein [Tepidisphaeraceae bacterium]